MSELFYCIKDNNTHFWIDGLEIDESAWLGKEFFNGKVNRSKWTPWKR